MIKASNEITQEYLKTTLRYDSELGRFFWLVARGSRGVVGNMAGNLRQDGYRHIQIDGKRLLEHRLVWLYVNGVLPEDQLDHINHDRDDNRIDNLRVVSCQENLRNSSRRNNNTSGITGVSWNNRDRKWQTQIRIAGKQKNLGYFEDYFGACCARKSAELQHGYHENHGSKK